MNTRSQLNRYIFCFLIILHSLPNQVLGQKIPIIDVSAVVFAGNSQTANIDIGLGIVASSITFFPSSNGRSYASSLTVTVYLSPLDRSAMVLPSTHTLLFRHHDPLSIEAGQEFVRALSFRRPAGEYLLEVVTNTVPSISVRENVIIPAYFEEPQMSLSNILFAAEIGQETDSDESSVNKHGIHIKPNPRASYGKYEPILKWYVESYANYDFVNQLAGNDEVDLHVWVSEKGGSEVVNVALQSEQVRKVKIWDAIIGAFDVSTLPSGEYDLHIELTSDSMEKVFEVASFKIINEGNQVAK